MPTDICPTRNSQLFFILTHWSYSKCKDILQTFNVYKIPAKEHQGAYRQDAEEISVSQILFWKYLEYVPLILQSYKKLNNSKIVGFKSSSFLSAQYFLVTAAQQFLRKGKSVP